MDRLSNIISKAIRKKSITKDESKYLVSPKVNFWDLLYGANKIRNYFKGPKIGLCSIINAKSGNCSEDCKFCAQSSHHSSEIKKYPLVTGKDIIAGYKYSKNISAQGFSIVTSGNNLSEKDFSFICRISKKITDSFQGPYVCASLGRLSDEQIKQLKKSGVKKLHHNIETSRRHFSKICSTHTYDERIQNIRNIKKAGLKICSGGVFGMGETWDDRIDMAFTLRDLKVDSIPLNFLIPVEGTSFENIAPLTPQKILKIIALYRYILPDYNIRVCAGREKNLDDMQSWIFYAGANGMMIGGYLTQSGRQPEEDLKMIKSLGLIPIQTGLLYRDC
jgi:biotin synthase